MPHRALFLLPLLPALLLSGLLTVLPMAAHAQTTRSLMPSAVVQARGGAAVALPGAATVFFYNPAHLAQVALPRPRIHLLGLRGGASTNVFDHWRFYQQSLKPALDEGVGTMPLARQQALYDRARVLGRRRALATGDVLLPSVMLRAGPASLAAGLFAHSRVRYRFGNGGAGVPVLDAVGQTDLIAAASAAATLSALGLERLSVGLTARYTRRYLTLKHKPADALDADEDAYLLRGSSAGLDLGLLYDATFLPLPGRLRLGLAVHDLIAAPFDYTYDRNLTRRGPDDEAAIAEETARANARHAEVRPSYRAGIAYTLPGALGPLRRTSVALDYVSARSAAAEQSLWTHLRIGLETRLLRRMVLRTGLSQGYPTAGLGLRAGPVRLDYAFYGTEGGRLPGQLPGWHHALQLAVGLY